MSDGSTPRYSRSFAANASGRSAGVTVPASISRSSSKRRMMWSEYVTSSASTRTVLGRTLFSARWNSSSGDVGERRGERAPAGADRRTSTLTRLRPTTFSQSRLCDSWNADDTPLRERRAEVGRVDLALVDPVPELVEAGEDAADVVGESRVVRRMSLCASETANGWTVSSRRHAWSSIPHAASIVEREGPLALDVG